MEVCPAHLGGWRGAYDNVYLYNIWNQEERGYWVSLHAIALALSLIQNIVINHGYAPTQ